MCADSLTRLASANSIIGSGTPGQPNAITDSRRYERACRLYIRRGTYPPSLSRSWVRFTTLTPVGLGIQVDKDEDGMISYEEYYKTVKANPAIIDFLTITVQPDDEE